MTVDGQLLFKRLVEIETKRQFPLQVKGRPRIITFDQAYEGILRILTTGMQWRHLDTNGISYITVFKTMHKWVEKDVFRTAYIRLLNLYRRKRRPRYFCIDSTFVKNVYGSDCVGRNPTDRGRKATKVSAVVDDIGVAHGLHFCPANLSDMKLFEPTMASLFTCLDQGKELYADKGYDSAANRETCQRYGMRDRLFRRRTTNSRRTHAKRGVVERFFSWIDKYRRLILRYERSVSLYEALTLMACGILLEKKLKKT